MGGPQRTGGVGHSKGGKAVTGLRVFGMALAVALAAPLPGAAETEESPNGVALLDAPGGHPVGWVRERGLLEVLEQRPGWKRVRFEGWISDVTGAVIRGEAQAPPGSEVFLLAAGPQALERFHAAQESARQAQAELQAEVDQLRKDRNKALRLDNFSEATTRYDELDEQYEQRLAELHTLRKRLLAEMSSGLTPQTLMASFLRADRTFELNPPEPGPYGVFVPMAEMEAFPCCWKQLQVEGDDVWVEVGDRPKKQERRKRRGEKQD